MYQTSASEDVRKTQIAISVVSYEVSVSKTLLNKHVLVPYVPSPEGVAEPGQSVSENLISDARLHAQDLRLANDTNQ